MMLLIMLALVSFVDAREPHVGDKVFVVMSTGDKLTGVLESMSSNLLCMNCTHIQAAGETNDVMGPDPFKNFNPIGGAELCLGAGQILSLSWQPINWNNSLRCPPDAVGGCEQGAT